MKVVIVPCGDFALTIQHQVNNYLNTKGFLVQLEYNDSVSIVKGLVEDIVFLSLKWTSSRSVYLTTLNEILNRLLNHDFDIENIRDDFVYRGLVEEVISIIDKVDVKLLNMLTYVTHLNESSSNWLTWSVKCMSTDLFLEPGMDYRILDWERRSLHGEIDF